MTFSDLVGKTVLSVDETSSDIMVGIKFTDGTAVIVFTERISPYVYAPRMEDCRAYQS